jgi:hypothetical protein
LETRIYETAEDIETQNQEAAVNETEDATRGSNDTGGNNGIGGNNRPIFRGIDTRRRRNNGHTEVADSTTLNRALNPYVRSEETPQNERGGAPRPPTPSIPVAEMRSNDAPQDDSIPVGNVIGLVPSPDRSGGNPEASARTTTTNLDCALLREARRDSAARYRISRDMYPELGTPQEERARDQQQQVIGNGRSIHSTAPRPSMIMLEEAAIMSPLAIDPELNTLSNSNKCENSFSCP